MGKGKQIEDAQMADAPSNDPRALSIYQDHIDLLTRSLMRNDFAPFLGRILLPHHIQTVNAEFLSRTAEDLQSLFVQTHQRLAEFAISQFVRIATKAWFVSETMIEGEHVSEMLRGSVRALPPFANRLRLVLGLDGIWRETHSANAVSVKAGQIGLFEDINTKKAVPPFGKVPESP